MSASPVLLHRVLDPLLGVFTGFLAYHFHETHPRNAPPPGERLTELIQWKWDKHQRQHKEKLATVEAGEQSQSSQASK